MTDYYVVYSDDKPVFDSRSGDAPPARDVQVIVQEHPMIGWHTQSGYDYYVKREEQHRWVGVDLFGLFDYLLDTGLVLFGRTMTQDDFDDAMKTALEIRRVEREKTGWLSGERKSDAA